MTKKISDENEGELPMRDVIDRRQEIDAFKSIGVYIKKAKAKEDIQSLIIDFFKKNPNPDDKKIHNIAEDFNIEPDKFEEHVYKILSDYINKPEFFIASLLKHGLDPDSKFNKKELEMGIEVEKEHNDSPIISKAIAKAHLSELEKYYTYLRKMEDEAKKKEGE